MTTATVVCWLVHLGFSSHRVLDPRFLELHTPSAFRRVWPACMLTKDVNEGRLRLGHGEAVGL